MTDRPRFSLSDWLLLLLVLAVAGGARAVYLIQAADKATTAGPLQVQAPPPELEGLPRGTEMLGTKNPNELEALVHNLSENKWFGSLAPFASQEERTAHTSPGYPWLVSLVHGFVRTEDLGRIIRWAQCGLGTLTAGLYFLFAVRAFRSRSVALLAGLFCALHPYWVINTAALNDGVVTSFALAVVLYLGVHSIQTGAIIPSLGYGLALAGLALLRAPLLPFAFVAVLWFLWRCREIERGWLCAVLAFLGFFNGLVPWTLRNFQAFDEPVPLVDSAYLHLWMGNNARSTGGPQSEGEALEALAEQRGVDAAELRDRLAKMKQTDRYRSLSGDVGAFARQRPAEFWENRFEAGLAFLLGEAWLKDRQLVWTASPGERAMPDWLEKAYRPALAGVLFLMLFLGLLGWRWTYGWRHEAMPSSLALVWVPLPYLLSHAGLLHGPRLPLDGVLLTYAAFALVCFIPGPAKELFAGTPKHSADGR